MSKYEVVVVGGGNAGMSAALAAREQGCRVLLLERAPYPARGGNTAYTGGIMRFAFEGRADVLELVPDLSPAQVKQSEFGRYSEDEFLDDMARVTEYRTDPDLAEALVRRSREAMGWLHSKGVRFVPSYGRQAYLVDGVFTFWGGLALEVSGGGLGLVESLERACVEAGIDIEYGARARALRTDAHGVTGVRVDQGLDSAVVECSAVVLASGGFQANPAWRAAYLGRGWDLAKVRGTRYDTGDGIEMALEVGASPAGNWSGCHAVAWELNAPEFGDRRIGDSYQKHSYPLGVVVNQSGERFLDEGADFRNYTYAKYGAEILRQPAQQAWQVFDGKVLPLLRDEYGIREVTKVRAESLEKLAERMEGINSKRFLETVHDFNASVQVERPFDPNVHDRRGTVGLDVPKSNWAQALDTPPFEAYAVTCGITFTFGGLRVNTEGQVLDQSGSPIPGLCGAGELVGGLFYFNYPGGSGLTAGTVFGRAAGYSAAGHAGGR